MGRAAAGRDEHEHVSRYRGDLVRVTDERNGLEAANRVAEGIDEIGADHLSDVLTGPFYETVQGERERDEERPTDPEWSERAVPVKGVPGRANGQLSGRPTDTERPTGRTPR